ncbi:hypothetical protein SAMN05446037_101216 [Anaerovirgula multivorans]|uniref:Uncharacterized protein n=1 Tax=Anaerovirgula multivorans TaxID=312168 RepID=A0A239F5Q2_9FIRM|nr:hypothetical protein [Anaerovirgula multivorans]SNS52071.1 hypothetical protein SAMN05446037_101216 [Anaerovirgula multivorans]
MIGNKYLQELYEYSDEDTSLNQLLELLKSKDKKFIDSLYKAIDLDICNHKEIKYLTVISALIDYYLQIYGFEVPGWLRDEKLSFSKPYYHSRRISDFDKIKLQYTNSAPLRTRNVYFDLDGIKRV